MPKEPAPKMVEAEYLGMSLRILENDPQNLEYFRYCAAGEFRLQKCVDCGLLRYPPSTACPWCSSFDAEWTLVEGLGAVHSYGEVHHAIQPAFREHQPYLILMVDLDTQKGSPTDHDALRVVGNLVTPEGDFAPPELVAQVGIGTRVRMLFNRVDDGLAVPHWTVDENAKQPDKPWRYPSE